MSIHPVDLSRSREFPDLTAVPHRLWKAFEIEVFDDMEADGDWAVSEDIKRHGIWEPVETAVMASAFAGNPDSTLIDIGCHVGWYTVLARQFGLKVWAFDAVPACLDMLDRRNDDDIELSCVWIEKGWEQPWWPEPCIVKMDIEGNEIHAFNAMRDLFDVGSVTHALIEMSPVFNGTYVKLGEEFVECGYELWVLPEKQTPPPVMDDTRRWLEEDCFGLHLETRHRRQAWIKHQHQFNAVVCKPESAWG